MLMNDLAQPRPSLSELLLGYLQLEGALPWPGADGLAWTRCWPPTARWPAWAGCRIWNNQGGGYLASSGTKPGTWRLA